MAWFPGRKLRFAPTASRREADNRGAPGSSDGSPRYGRASPYRPGVQISPGRPRGLRQAGGAFVVTTPARPRTGTVSALNAFRGSREMQMTMTDPVLHNENNAAAKLDRIRAALASSEQSAEEALDRIAEIVGDRRRPKPVYQKPLG